ncbi:hypothetical protein PLEOSDRAFT_1087208 [Pleurotus ostreatus PC15]|uniref:Uncharacterized protein n=1 Tax=Pleurotus ostreatus (strain PC15) TaxID=1137138 RepID=A0A067NET5_PLEO1|nr:hypothetical protein PLEOSDRAFT_1087208 [Pleurotus ostreatus PC15]
MAGSDLETRQRYATWTWRRRSGEVLPRPTCRGKRPPNGFMWAPTPSQFYWISRIPEVGYMTIWSKSMIVEFEETSAELAAKGIALERLEDQEAPKKCEPWPLLSLPVAACSDRGEDSDASRRSIRGGRIGPMLPLDLGDKDAKATGGSLFGNTYGFESKLEELIPASFYPDVLIVNDPRGITEGKRVLDPAEGADALESLPRHYKRVWPDVDRLKYPALPAPGNVAYLNLAGAPHLGHGSHSSVHRASLRLPGALAGMTTDGSVSVAAKIAFPITGARAMLDHEAEMYTRVYGPADDDDMVLGHSPALGTKNEENEKDGEAEDKEELDPARHRHLMEHFTGFNIMTPHLAHPVPVGAVLPKLYGYYIPCEESEAFVRARKTDKNPEDYWRTRDYGSAEKNKPPKNLLSPILLMEDCGTPINPRAMSIDDRTECYSFLLRLQNAEFNHNSFWIRNILTQPGPLHLPPHERTNDVQSYRLIDAGRMIHWYEYIEGRVGMLPEPTNEKEAREYVEKVENAGAAWERCKAQDTDYGLKELLLEGRVRGKPAVMLSQSDMGVRP